MEERVKGDALGDRMKGYEDAYRITLPKRMPVIIRVDGRAFHTATARCKRPFDEDVAAAMDHTAKRLVDGLQGACLAYVQSDEISLLLVNYRTLTTQAAFGNGLQKLVSVSASIATQAFAERRPTDMGPAQFDSRAFVLPEAEVCNYFIWRQQDAMRNAVQMIARARFSHRECENKSCAELTAMLGEVGDPVESYAAAHRFGRIICHDGDGIAIDDHIPIFKASRSYIERHLRVADDEAA